ncbi:ATP-binding protein [Thermatribacter velox]|uniref:ATP-binding protein n=1 Tax=Thermatribacter velox TaxID=3039681 RepID=A0ABZ2YBE6_9BACT
MVDFLNLDLENLKLKNLYLVFYDILYKGVVKMFINREKECEFLKRKLSSNKAELLVIYGRRRVGKTFLLQNCLEKALFFTADLSSSIHLMNRFLDEIKSILALPSTLRISSWDEFFGFLKNVFEAKRDLKVVVFDEFQYIPMRDESFTSVLQRWWDEIFSKLGVKMILCGSYIGMIEKIVLTRNSPIYGRRTGQYQVLPLDFFESVKFLNFESTRDFVKAYSVTDGIPLYLLEFSGYRDFYTALTEKVLTAGEYLVEEGKFLTLEEFKDPSNYYSILQSIAQGKTVPSEIADISGVDYKSIGMYLSRLMELKFVNKEFPFFINRKPKRKPHYYLSDEYLRFYFRYIYPNQELIYRNLKEEALRRITATLDQHVSFTFEKVARQYLIKREGVEKVGRWWNKEIEIDVVAIKGKTLYVGKCKWTNKRVDIRVLNKLRSKVPYLLKDLQVSDFSIIYYLFSKSGFENLEESDEVKLIDLERLFLVNQ